MAAHLDPRACPPRPVTPAIVPTCGARSLEGRPRSSASPSPGFGASLPCAKDTARILPGHPAIRSARVPRPRAPGWLTARPALPKPRPQQWERGITVSVSDQPLPRPDSRSRGSRLGSGGL